MAFYTHCAKCGKKIEAWDKDLSHDHYCPGGCENEYTGDDFAFDLIAGIYSEADRIRAEQGEEAFRAYLDDNVMTVGAMLLDMGGGATPTLKSRHKSTCDSTRSRGSRIYHSMVERTAHNDRKRARGGGG